MSPPQRILIADDEEVIREACFRIIKRMGYEVDVAVDGREAMDLLRDDHYDLLLLDLKMPAMDGMKVMAAVNREFPDLRIIIITGHGTQETAAETALAGAHDFLAKPFSPAQLRSAVKRITKQNGVAETPTEEH